MSIRFVAASRRSRPAGAGVLLLAVVLLIVAGAAATAQTLGLAATPARISRTGVGPVKLGVAFTQLRARGLVGRLRAGCQLAGPQSRSATLSGPLRGVVDFTMSSSRRVTDITVARGGVTDRGIGIGATIAQIKRAYPKAVVDHSTDRAFQTTFVKVPRSEGGRLQFGVSVRKHRTVLIGIPFIATCD
ncbi:MAG: hypothetical protein M3Z27_07565 [Actinomycetota bacterium]|nr:hypothetical protein [Actinomycetota bacterium]